MAVYEEKRNTDAYKAAVEEYRDIMDVRFYAYYNVCYLTSNIILLHLN